MTFGPRPQLLRNVDWSFPTVAAMQAALQTLDGFVPGQSIKAGGRKFILRLRDGRIFADETTEAPPQRPGFNDIGLERLPIMEAAGFIGNPNGWADFAQALTVAQVLGVLGIETFGNLDSGGFRIATGNGTVLCQLRAGRGTTSASGGVAVTFSPAMTGCNVVLLNGQNDGSLPVASFSWSNVNNAGFTAHGRLASDGTRVARNFSYIAIGR